MRVFINGGRQLDVGDLALVCDYEETNRPGPQTLVFSGWRDDRRVWSTKLYAMGLNPVARADCNCLVLAEAFGAEAVVIVGSNRGAVISSKTGMILGKFRCFFTWKSSLDICVLKDSPRGFKAIITTRGIAIVDPTDYSVREITLPGLATGRVESGSRLGVEYDDLNGQAQGQWLWIDEWA